MLSFEVLENPRYAEDLNPREAYPSSPPGKWQKECEPLRRCPGRLIHLECDPDACPRGDNCVNSNITWKRTNPHVAVAPAGVTAAGFGVFATRDLKAGEFVLEYKGDVMPYDRWCQDVRDIKDAKGQEGDWPYVREELYGMSITEVNL